jgi:nucleoside-diphosphate-sugar epimerase
MNIVTVIGGSGFIGTRLVNRLRSRSDLSVCILDKALSVEHADITRLVDVRSIEDLRELIPHGSTVVNLAAEHHDNVRPVSLYQQVNVTGAENICSVAREKDVTTIVFTSSVAVYGFARIGADESAEIAPFNHYGRTKYEAEQVFRAWQNEVATERRLVIVRPTVVFGEKNRGNVYQLLKLISLRRFVMVGGGENRKSMAYVEKVAAFIEFSISSKPGVYVYNFVDKPDLTINRLVTVVRNALGQSGNLRFRVPFPLAFLVGKLFDLLAAITGRNFSISAIRVKKFCTDSVYESAVVSTGFKAPVSLQRAIEETIKAEFLQGEGSSKT